MNIGLIATNELRRNAYIDGNVSEQDLQTSLMIAQETMLQPVIGTVLYEKLINDVEDVATEVNVNALIEPYKTLLNDRIKDLLTYYTVYQLINTKIYRITNSGIVKDNDSIDISEMKIIARNIENIYLGYERMLLSYLWAHTKDFPEFNTDIDGGDSANSEEDSVSFFDWETIND